MKSLSLLSTGTVCFALMACSTAAEPPSSGGAGSSAGGAAPQGGSAPVAGANNGGSPPVAGASMGGSAPTAGADNGGTPAVAGAGGAGGAAPTAGGGGTGGTATGGSGGGSAGGGTVGPELVGAWDGALLQYACGTIGSSYDCDHPAAAMCKNGSSLATVSTIPTSNNVPSSWTMGGTPGTVYEVTFRIRGIVEVTSYVGGTRAGDASVLTTPRNLFQVGGTPQDQGGPSFDYNTYELHVTPPVAGAASNDYYLNSVTTAQNPHASGTPTSHLTYDIDYTAKIKVQGGGKVTVKVTDSNCKQVQNCGPTTGGNKCEAPRSLSLAGATPAAPTFAQPFQNGNNFGQWIFFDITDVKVAQ